MGAGIVEVFARNGLDVVAVEVIRRGCREGRGVLRQSTDRALARGKLTEQAQTELHRPGSLHLRPRRPRRVRPRGRGRAREARPQARHLRQARHDREAGRDPRHQHLQPVRHRDLGGHAEPAPGGRDALLQPGAGAEVRRGHPHCRHRGRRRGGRQGARRTARQDARRHRRQGRIHRQRAAVRLPQPCRRHVREPIRHPGRHRRGDAAGLRTADGPARADGPHWPGHGLRDPGHDVQAGTRPAARAEPHPQADGHRRAQGAQDRPGLLHLRPGRQLQGRPRQPHAARRRRPRGGLRLRTLVSLAPARWRPGSSRCSPRPGMP